MGEKGKDTRGRGDDRQMVEHIHDLVAEYHQLERQHHGLALGSDQRGQLAALQGEVDRQWDDLRRARAAKRLSKAGALAPLRLMRRGPAR